MFRPQHFAPPPPVTAHVCDKPAAITATPGVAAVMRRDRPDVALVCVGARSDALRLLSEIAQDATCPAILLLQGPDPGFVQEASRHGAFAYTTDPAVGDWRSSIDIVVRRFSEFRDLAGAFERRAITERAKGILMERHEVGEAAAFAMLRDEARSTNRTLVDVATSVAGGHRLLPRGPGAADADDRSRP